MQIFQMLPYFPHILSLKPKLYSPSPFLKHWFPAAGFCSCFLLCLYFYPQISQHLAFFLIKPSPVFWAYQTTGSTLFLSPNLSSVCLTTIRYTTCFVWSAVVFFQVWNGSPHKTQSSTICVTAIPQLLNHLLPNVDGWLTLTSFSQGLWGKARCNHRAAQLKSLGGNHCWEVEGRSCCTLLAFHR